MSTQVIAPDLAEVDFDKFREDTCVHCDRSLTIADVKAALKRNPESVPGKIYCRRKECQEEYKKRLENDPAIEGVDEIPPRPETGVVTVPSDLSDEPKLARIRLEAGLPLEKRDRDIAEGLRELVPPPNQCSHHNDPRTCSVCGTDKVSNPVPLQNQKERDRLAAQLQETGWGQSFAGTSPPNPPAEPEKELSLEEEVQKILARRKLKDKPAKPNRREQKVLDRIRVLSSKDLSLRLEYGLGPRQLVAILDKKDSVFWAEFQVTDEEFGRTDPKMRRWLLEIQNGHGRSIYKTIAKNTGWATNNGKVLVRPGNLKEWRSLLPLKKVKVLTDTEVAFYRDYAARNLIVADMKAKYGEVSDEQIRLLENRIIRRAFYCRLLNTPLGLKAADFDRDRDHAWKLEEQAIAKGVSYIGSIFGSNRPGSRPTRLGTSPVSRSKRSGVGREDTGTDSDDYGEESGS